MNISDRLDSDRSRSESFARETSDSSSSSSENTAATDFSDYNPVQDPEFVAPAASAPRKRKAKPQKQKKGKGKKRKTESKPAAAEPKSFKYERYRHGGPPITKVEDIPKG